MSEPDHQRVALVTACAPDLPGESVATGYFLTGDLVLTVRHVADQPGSMFEVRCGLPGPEADQWARAVPVWVGDGDIDAMLLRTARSFGYWKPPAFPQLGERGTWESSGYARGARNDSRADRKTLPLQGTFGVSRGQGPPELVLTTEQVIAANQNYLWSGISGAAVFSGERGCDGLIGIVTDASNALANSLAALPTTRLFEDIRFWTTVLPSRLGRLPDRPFCAVLTSETSTSDLSGDVLGVLTGYRNEDIRLNALHNEPFEIPVLEAVASVENWAATVEALARADFLVADVTSFEPAVMLLLGVRSVLRRGVTVSVTAGRIDAEPQLQTSDGDHSEGDHSPVSVPFNVQETRVLSYDDDEFYENLHRAMTEGAAAVAEDPNYLDLPAYHGVRSPRPGSWASEDHNTILVLCPFNRTYSRFYKRTLRPIIQAHSRNKQPRRMLDLRSPRLVGQALYEQIRWGSFCLVDWTGWRANVFFELGVRLACSEQDPLGVIEASDRLGSAEAESSPLKQHGLLVDLFGPVPYDRAQTRTSLKDAIESWSMPPTTGRVRIPSGGRLPPAATFVAASEHFVWTSDPMLTLPYIDQRERTERIHGSDQEKRPERLVLFAENKDFDAELRAAVREQWIAAWLYLRHVVSAGGDREDLRDDFLTVSRLVEHVLSSSREPRHLSLREEIRGMLRVERAQRRARRLSGSSD